MAKTFLMLGIICLLAVFLMVDFIAVIPKFGAEKFGAPDDVKAFVKDMPDRPMAVNILGVIMLVAGFAGVIAVFVWAIRDTIQTKMTFLQAFARFLILLEGYKLFDIIFFDWLMLTKWKLPLKLYPETEGFQAYDSFGFNAKSQTAKLIVFFLISLLLAFVLTKLIH